MAEPLAAGPPPEAQGTLAEMVAARRTAIEQELVAAEMQALADAPVAGASIGRIEKTAGGSLMRLLSPEAGEAFKADISARRQEIALAPVARSEDRRDGQRCVGTCRSAWGP